MRKFLLAAVAVMMLAPGLALARTYGGYGGGGFRSYGGGYHSYAAPRIYVAPRPYYRPHVFVPIVPIIPIVPLDPCPYDYRWSSFYDRCVPIY